MTQQPPFTRTRPRPRPSVRSREGLRSWLRLESLEDRSVPSVYTVSNILDAGPGSLRQAVLDANAHAGADEIRFKHTAEGTITLLSQLSVTGDLTVNGPGAGDLTVSGGGATRVLNVAAGVNVAVKDLTIANGKVTGAAKGAGILNAGTLTIDKSVITGNLASFQGGGIENTGTLTVKRSSVSANRAVSSGGGIHNAGTGVVVIERSTVSNNTCVGDGAGIRSEVGTVLTVTESTVSGNSASGYGTGGIASGATFTLRDSLVAGNTSAAAGIYLMGFSRGGEVLITHSTIRDNGPSATSRSGVGGIWSYSSNKIRVEDTDIRNNSGDGFRAGGAWGFGKWDVLRTSIDHNTGGGFSPLQTATVVESTISGNTGTLYGGINTYGDLDLIRSTVSGNTAIPSPGAYAAAGGIFAGGFFGGGQTHIQNSTISGNVVVADQMQAYHGSPYDVGAAAGGVLTLHPGVTIDNSTIAFNRVTNAPADLEVSGGVAIGHITTYFGTYFGDVAVRNTIIARNASNAGGPDVTGGFTSGGHNLVGVLTADATGFVASDLRGTAAHPLDPKLKPLANNGGPTRTHALAAGSPALNAGDNAGAPATDQRGSTRIVGGVIDIGAYESRRGDDDDDREDDLRSALVAPPSFAPPSTTQTNAPRSLGVTVAGGRPNSVAWSSPPGRSHHLPTFWFDPFDRNDGFDRHAT